MICEILDSRRCIGGFDGCAASRLFECSGDQIRNKVLESRPLVRRPATASIISWPRLEVLLATVNILATFASQFHIIKLVKG